MYVLGRIWSESGPGFETLGVPGFAFGIYVLFDRDGLGTDRVARSGDDEVQGRRGEDGKDVDGKEGSVGIETHRLLRVVYKDGPIAGWVTDTKPLSHASPLYVISQQRGGGGKDNSLLADSTSKPEKQRFVRDMTVPVPQPDPGEMKRNTTCTANRSFRRTTGIHSSARATAIAVCIVSSLVDAPSLFTADTFAR